MKLLTVLVISVLFAIIQLFMVVGSASADTSNYKTAYNVTYTIDPNGIAHTEMKINLTNKTSQFYASSYKLQVGFNDVTNIRASDRSGAITPVLKKIPEGYQVELEFNDRVVGINNTLTFNISFDTQSIAKKHGEL